MAERWTIKQLESMSDVDFIKTILQERLNKLTNCYSPLASRLKGAKHALSELQLFISENMEEDKESFEENGDRPGELVDIDSPGIENEREDMCFDAGHYRALEQVGDILSKVTL